MICSSPTACRRVCAAGFTLLLLAPAAARADDNWRVVVEPFVMSAPALPGVVLGGMAEGQRQVSNTLHLTLAFGGGGATDANETWVISQTHWFVLAGAGVAGTLGKARLSADAQAGGLFIAELDRRQQFDRLTLAGASDRERTGGAGGALVRIELAVELELLDRWSLRLSGGPQGTWITVNDTRRWQAGLFSGVGVVHAF